MVGFVGKSDIFTGGLRKRDSKFNMKRFSDGSFLSNIVNSPLHLTVTLLARSFIGHLCSVTNQQLAESFL